MNIRNGMILSLALPLAGLPMLAQAQYEYQADEGVHQQEWYDPSDWFNERAMEREEPAWWNENYNTDYFEETGQNINQAWDRGTQPLENAGENIERTWDRGTRNFEQEWDEETQPVENAWDRGTRNLNQAWDRGTQPLENAGENIGRAWDRETQPIENAWDETFYGNWYDDERRMDQRQRDGQRARAQQDMQRRMQQDRRTDDFTWNDYYTGYEQGRFAGNQQRSQRMSERDRNRDQQARYQGQQRRGDDQLWMNQRNDRARNQNQQSWDQQRSQQARYQQDRQRSQMNRNQGDGNALFYSYYVWDPNTQQMTRQQDQRSRSQRMNDQRVNDQRTRTDSPRYQQMQSDRRTQSVRGKITGIERVRGAYGAPESVRLKLQTQDGKERTLHVGDLPFAQRTLPRFRQGEDVVIGGSTMNVNGKEMFKAQEIRSQNSSYLIPEYAYNKRIEGTLEGIRKVATQDGDIEAVVAKVRNEDGSTVNVLLGNASDIQGQEHMLKKGTTVRVDGYERKSGNEKAFVVQNVRIRDGGSQSRSQSDRQSSSQSRSGSDNQQAQNQRY